MADAKKSGERSEPKKKAAPTKAQTEMDRYRARQAGGGTPPSPFGAGPVQWAFMAPPQGAGGQGWPLPPSMMPMQGGAPMPGGYPGMFPPGLQGGAADGGVTGRLGSTLGLGVDAVNALLAGSIAMLQRMSAGYGYGPGYAPQGGYGYGYGYAYGGHQGCGCGHGGHHGCGCHDPCMTECGYDCCCSMGCGTCCNPGVGSCC
jgi:hypothetical protein